MNYIIEEMRTDDLWKGWPEKFKWMCRLDNTKQTPRVLLEYELSSLEKLVKSLDVEYSHNSYGSFVFTNKKDALAFLLKIQRP